MLILILAVLLFLIVIVMLWLLTIIFTGTRPVKVANNNNISVIKK